MTANKPELYFQCSHCELKDKQFSYFQRQHQNDACKVQIQNLPEGITEEGVRNLFVTVGIPLRIELNKNHSALVVLESINQGELAVRDLHKKPPYFLKLTILHQEVESSVRKHKIDIKVNETNSWDFSVKENSVECRAATAGDCKEDEEKMNELITLVRNTVNSLDYNPSIRMRQKVLDFKSEPFCVSKGRGYMDMGKVDRFVGGLEKFVFVSKNCKSMDKMNFSCENCQSRTAKVCWDCHASYCSVACLSKSAIHHLECSPDVRKKEANDAVAGSLSSQPTFRSNQNFGFRDVDLTSGCTVVMSSYRSMQSVFVRRTDDKWEDEFARLCNVIAAEALKGEELKEAPEEGEVVLSKYYQDLCYYRARVTSKSSSGSKISVFFIDFGNTQETDLADVKPLPERLKSVPGYAFRVHLKGVSEDSTLESVEYFNELTAEQIPLILNYEGSTDEVVLVEKDSNTDVNKTVIAKALPSWKTDSFVATKLGDIYYLDSINPTKLEVGKACSLIISHFNESEFLESDRFWVTRPDTDDFAHVNSTMRRQMLEFCLLLKDDCYLPRIDEVCLAKENGEWHRCVNLQSHKTTCCLLFLDDGHCSSIETANIRKMVQDFTEAPSQAVCCVLAGDPKLKTEKELRSKVVEYMKEVAGKRVDSVNVLKLVGDAYCLSFPRIDEIVTQFVGSLQSGCATDD